MVKEKKFYKFGLGLLLFAVLLSPINVLAATRYVYRTTVTADSRDGLTTTRTTEVVESNEETENEEIGEKGLINPGFEMAGVSGSEAFGWQAYQSGYSRVGVFKEGNYGIRLHNSDEAMASGAYQRIDLDQDVLKPVFIGGYVMGNNIIKSPGGYFGASLYAEIHMTDGAVAYWNSIANYGTFSWRWIGFNTGTLSQVDAPIDHIFVVPILSQAVGTAYFDDIKVEEYEATAPAVTIMIDDGELNTYTEAKPVLDILGIDASVSIITGMVGNEGFMDWEQLIDLRNNGWEIVSHGLSHSDMTEMTARQASLELQSSKRLLQRRGFTINSFAFPFGAYNGNLIGLSMPYYSSSRLYEQGDNPAGAFPYDIKVRGVLDSTTPADVASWLEEARNDNSWVVLTFHTIAPDGVDAYHSTPETFKAIVDVVAGSGIDVLTYEQGIKRFAAQ